MKIYTSYFYMIRFMKPNMIPLSTAKWDPQWFHKGLGNKYQWKDKNGVWNGLRAPEFAPGPVCEGLCEGSEKCNKKNPDSCLFLNAYRYQLDQLDYNDIIKRCENIANCVKEREQFKEEPIIILLVHEAPNNFCSERCVIQEWFASHGKKVEEWKKNIYD